MAHIQVERLPGGYPGVQHCIEHPFVQRLAAVGAELYGTPLALMPQGPFALPLYFFAEALRVPVAVIGCARPDSAVHAPNEHIAVADLIPPRPDSDSPARRLRHASALAPGPMAFDSSGRLW